MRSALRSRVRPLLQGLSTKLDPLESPAVSLFYDRAFDHARPEVEASFLGRLALSFGGYYSGDSHRRRGANNLYDAVVEQAESAEFFRTMQLQRDAFAAVHNVLGLHMWLLIKRLNLEEDNKNAKKLSQLVYDQFLHDVDLRVHKAGVRVRVSQKLEDLERKFYGRCVAYDSTLAVDSKESLADALLRNVYEGDKDKAFASRLLERYLKREMECLRKTERDAVMRGKIKFTSFRQPPL